jgi:hypothetical protein
VVVEVRGNGKSRSNGKIFNAEGAKVCAKGAEGLVGGRNRLRRGMA